MDHFNSNVQPLHNNNASAIHAAAVDTTTTRTMDNSTNGNYQDLRSKSNGENLALGHSLSLINNQVNSSVDNQSHFNSTHITYSKPAHSAYHSIPNNQTTTSSQLHLPPPPPPPNFHHISTLSNTSQHHPIHFNPNLNPKPNNSTTTPLVRINHPPPPPVNRNTTFHNIQQFHGSSPMVLPNAPVHLTSAEIASQPKPTPHIQPTPVETPQSNFQPAPSNNKVATLPPRKMDNDNDASSTLMQLAEGVDPPRSKISPAPTSSNRNGSVPREGSTKPPRKYRSNKESTPNGKGKRKSTDKTKKKLVPQTVRPVKTIHPSMDEMNNFPFMIHKWHAMALEHGAIHVIPPDAWEHPPCRLLPTNTFYTRGQQAPIAPFNGRVHELDEFSTTNKRTTLKSFKEYATKTQEKLGFEDIPMKFGQPLDEQGMAVLLRNEKRFFELEKKGFGPNQKSIKLYYGVDVEAEGAFDPATKCYDEYNVDGDDCLVHPENRDMDTEDEDDEADEKQKQQDIQAQREMMEVESMLDVPAVPRKSVKEEVAMSNSKKNDGANEVTKVNGNVMDNNEKNNANEEGQPKAGEIKLNRKEPQEEGQISENDSARAEVKQLRPAGETVASTSSQKSNNPSVTPQPTAALGRFAFRSKPAPTPQTVPTPTPTHSTQNTMPPLQPVPAFPGTPLAGLQHGAQESVVRNRASPKSKGTRRLAVQPNGSVASEPVSEVVPSTAINNPSAVCEKDEELDEEVIDGNHKPTPPDTGVDGLEIVPMQVDKPEEGSKSNGKMNIQTIVTDKPETEEEVVIDGGNGNEKSQVAHSALSSKVSDVQASSSKTQKVVCESQCVSQEETLETPDNTNGNGAQTLLKSSKKRPRRGNPVSHVGNVNNHGVLRHSPASPGINRPMFYVGASGTKFCFHTEDMYLNSISYMHEDSAVKVWYVIPAEQAELVERYASEKVFTKRVYEHDSVNKLLASKTTMMDPFAMAKYGISVYRVCQTPGTFVITAPQGYHGGFNNGFNIAEAVNFANPDWLRFGRAAAELYAKEKRDSVVPYEYVVFHEASCLAKQVDEIGVEKMRENAMTREFAKLVAKEMRYYAIELEKVVRKYAIEERIHIATIHDLETRFTLPSLHPTFGNGAGLVCVNCQYKSHFYASTCSTCEDKIRAKCVKCFKKGAKVCTKKGHKIVITRRHPPLLLLDMLHKIEEVANISVSDKEKVNRIMNITENWRLPPVKTTIPELSCTLRLSRAIVPPEANLVKPPTETECNIIMQDIMKKRKRVDEKRREVAKKRRRVSEDEKQKRKLNSASRGSKKRSFSGGDQGRGRIDDEDRIEIDMSKMDDGKGKRRRLPNPKYLDDD